MPATRNIIIWLLLLAIGPMALSQTALEGTVLDEETKEPIIFGTVILMKNGVLIRGSETDVNGAYSFYNVDPGTYDVEFSYIGYQSQKVQGVVLFAGKTNRLNAEISAGLVLDEVVVVDYKVPLVEQDNTTSGGVITGEQIRNLPTKNVQQLAAQTAGISSIDGEAVAIRGSRTNATLYYIDGIRVSSANLIAQSEIDQMQVITGGIEARYGDATGGVVSITTKGPSNTFSGGVELETSSFLDPYNYNEINTYLTGPILKKRNGQSIIGYRFSGRFRYFEDDGPSAIPSFRARPDVISALEEDPVRLISGSAFSSSEFLHNEDIDGLNYNPNEESELIDITGKIDAQLSPNIDISLSGSYRDLSNRFTPGAGSTAFRSGAWSLLNYQNNPVALDERYRINLRWRHRLGQESTQQSKGLIRNASYQILAGYENLNGERYDDRFKDNLFRYGHVGSFDFSWVPAEGESTYSGSIFGLAHAGFLQVLNEPFTPSPYNPVLANYNKLIDQTNFAQYAAINGFVSNSFNSSWGIYSSVGDVYNRNIRFESDRLTLNFSGSFDIVPAAGGRHSIEFGVAHEQLFSRGWTVAPFNLWQVARLQANRHINGVDTTQVIGSFPGIVASNLTFEEFQKLIVEDSDLDFYKEVRELTGSTLFDYVNVDGIDPDLLRLDMFSQLELTDQRIVSFNGYDYLGNRIDNDVEFLDFFNDRDANGRRTFPVGAFQPIYQSAYIQDKFSFRDIIFRVGLRVDRFDANTQVLRDELSLYEIMNANDFYGRFGGNRPNAVEDDYKVYVSGPNSDVVKAFRKGDQWYFANGTPANDGNIIFGGEIVYPQYYEERVNDIKADDFDPSQTFEDYDPQINWMPRVAVSFPISDVANFFAHYDVLVQRPPSGNVATPLDWYYFEDGNFTFANPFSNSNLRPETTIDYEVGFQQKLSNSSALKINAYYKELRDMLQQKTLLFLPSPISSYTTYGNIDFGTVKGFSFQYDLRRSNNVSALLNYTLQFADGTGSNLNSQAGLTTRGNLRTLFPLNRDERHAFKMNLDYRFASGNRYNGPVLFGQQIFANAGINVQSFLVSGRPYTQTIRPSQFGGDGFFGSINGARKPWTFTMDIRADKSFRLNAASERPLFVNISLRVLNVLNRENVRNVYSASGSPYDSGFILSSDGEATLENVRSTGAAVLEAGRDEQAYLDTFGWAILNPGNFFSPRRIFLSARIDF